MERVLRAMWKGLWLASTGMALACGSSPASGPSAGGLLESEGTTTLATGGELRPGAGAASGGQVRPGAGGGGEPLGAGSQIGSGGNLGGERDAGTPLGPGPTAGDAGSAADAGENHNAEDDAEREFCASHPAAAPQVLSLSGSTFAHDPTLAKANGTYYRFWTGDYIPSASSVDLRHWQDAPPVYSGAYPGWVENWLSGIPGNTFNFPWAPDISTWGGEVHLYASFSARFGDNVSCIAHLTADDMAAGKWRDHGPVLCTSGSERYNAIDPDVGLDTDGTPVMAFGSFWDGIMAVRLAPDGTPVPGQPTPLAWAREIEAPVLLRRCGYHYLFVTLGLCCPGAGRSVSDLTYRVVVGRSDHIMGPYVDRAGKPMLEGGGTLVVQGDGVNWAAAGHSDVLVDGDAAYHLYHAYRKGNGAAEFRVAELFFDAEGWPVPHPP